MMIKLVMENPIRRICALTLCAVLVLSQLGMTTRAADADIYITNASELAELADDVNSGDDYEDVTVALTRDIDLSGVVSAIDEEAGFDIIEPEPGVRFTTGGMSGSSYESAAGEGWTCSYTYSGSFGANNTFQAGGIYSATAYFYADTDNDYYFDTEDNMTYPEGWTLEKWSRSAITMTREYSLEDALATHYSAADGSSSVSLGSYYYFFNIIAGETRSDTRIANALVTLYNDGSVSVELPQEDEENEITGYTLTTSGVISVYGLDFGASGYPKLSGLGVTLIDTDFTSGVRGVIGDDGYVRFYITDTDGSADVTYDGTVYSVSVSGADGAVSGAAVTGDENGLVVALQDALTAAECVPLPVSIQSSGGAASGMNVTLCGPDFASGVMAAADADGSVVFGLTDESGSADVSGYTVSAADESGSALAGVLTAASAGAVSLCLPTGITLDALGAVTVTVADASGSPVSGVTVTLRDDEISTTSETAENGEAYFNINSLISSVSFSVTEPSAGAEPQRELEIDDSSFTAEITWYLDDEEFTDDAFGYDSAYTAMVTVYPADGYTFSETVSGPSGWTRESATGTAVVFSYTFDETEEEITSVTFTTYVTAPVAGSTPQKTASISVDSFARFSMSSALSWYVGEDITTPFEGVTFEEYTVYTVAITATSESGHAFSAGNLTVQSGWDIALLTADELILFRTFDATGGIESTEEAASAETGDETEQEQDETDAETSETEGSGTSKDTGGEAAGDDSAASDEDASQETNAEETSLTADAQTEGETAEDEDSEAEEAAAVSSSDTYTEDSEEAADSVSDETVTEVSAEAITNYSALYAAADSADDKSSADESEDSGDIPDSGDDSDREESSDNESAAESTDGAEDSGSSEDDDSTEDSGDTEDDDSTEDSGATEDSGSTENGGGDDGSETDTEYVSWTPIGSFAAPFRGTFDGCGYAVTGLYIDTEDDCAGLFGCTADAVIANLSVEGDVSGGSYVGGIVGYAVDTVFTSCAFLSEQGELYQMNLAVSTVSGADCVGGLVGMADSCTFSVCLNTGEITGSDCVGGIVGYMSGGSIDSALRLGTVYAAGEPFGAITASGFDCVTNAYYLENSCYLTGESTESAEPADSAYATAITSSAASSDELVWLLNTSGGTTVSTGLWSRGVKYPIPAELTETPVEVYKITVSEMPDGLSLAPSPEYAAEGETVTLAVTTNENVVLTSVSAVYTDAEGETQKITLSWDEEQRTFTMPAADVTVTAEAEETDPEATYTFTLNGGESDDGEYYGYFGGETSSVSQTVSGLGASEEVTASSISGLTGSTLAEALDAAAEELTYSGTTEERTYVFTGWYYADGTEFEYFADAVFYKDIELYAHWAYQATLTFDISNRTEGAEGSSAPEAQTRLAGETFTNPGDAEWTTETNGNIYIVHTFQGWYESASPDEDESAWSFSTAVSEETVPASDFTLYAVWTTSYATKDGTEIETKETGDVDSAQSWLDLAEAVETDLTEGSSYYYIINITSDFELDVSDRASSNIWSSADDEFYGIIYGQGHTITLGADSNASTTDWSDTGFIHTINSSSGVYDLTIEADWSLPSGQIDNHNNQPEWGVLCVYNYGEIDNCSALVNISAEGEDSVESGGNAYANDYGVGGLVSINCGTMSGCTLLSGSSVASEYSKSVVGGIAGYNYGVMTDCTTEEDTSVSGYQYVGGIAGYVEYNTTNGLVAELTGCVNNADVAKVGGDSTLTDGIIAVGGIAGSSYSNSSSSSNNVQITDYANNGSISGSTEVSKSAYVGGIVGYIHHSTVISECWNTGDIDVGGFTHAGGILGCIMLSSGTGEDVSRCYSTGSISGDPASSGSTYFGGIAGLVYSLEVVIEHCYSTGDINVPDGGCVGGIAGGDRGTYKDCFWYGEVLSGEQWGAVVATESSSSNVSITACYYGFSSESGSASGTEYTAANQSDSCLVARDDFTNGYLTWLLETDGGANTAHNNVWTMYTGTASSNITEAVYTHPILGSGSIYLVTGSFKVQGSGGAGDVMDIRPYSTAGKYTQTWEDNDDSSSAYIAGGSGNVVGFYCNDLINDLWTDSEDDTQVIYVDWSFSIEYANNSGSNVEYGDVSEISGGEGFSVGPYFITQNDDVTLTATVSADLSEPEEKLPVEEETGDGDGSGDGEGDGDGSGSGTVGDGTGSSGEGTGTGYGGEGSGTGTGNSEGSEGTGEAAPTTEQTDVEIVPTDLSEQSDEMPEQEPVEEPEEPESGGEPEPEPEAEEEPEEVVEEEPEPEPEPELTIFEIVMDTVVENPIPTIVVSVCVVAAIAAGAVTRIRRSKSEAK